VREVSDFPAEVFRGFGAEPQSGHSPERKEAIFPERHSLSAHRAAEPQAEIPIKG